MAWASFGARWRPVSSTMMVTTQATMITPQPAAIAVGSQSRLRR